MLRVWTIEVRNQRGPRGQRSGRSRIPRTRISLTRRACKRTVNRTLADFFPAFPRHPSDRPRARRRSRGASAGSARFHHHGRQEDHLNTQDWLARLLARPLADPLDWESYSVTMAESTWKALWDEIEVSQAYDDGLELGLRLLQATRQHREQLNARVYASSQIRLYRSILGMLDKAERWDAYLHTWEAILTQTDLCLSLKGDAIESNPALAALVRRPDGGLGLGVRPYGAPRPARMDVHFLHTQLGRKAVVVRRLAQEQHRTPSSPPRPDGRATLTAKDIEQRLMQAGDVADGP